MAPLSALALCWTLVWNNALPFAPKPALVSRRDIVIAVGVSYHKCRRHGLFSVLDTSFEDDEDEDEEEEEDEEDDPYAQMASSEFLEDPEESSSLATPTTSVDWGGALGTLRNRIGDQEKGVSHKPSNALFRVMTSQSPNEAIGNFVTSADPQVIAAMSGAVSSLLGGLSNPTSGIETIVKASGEKIGSLCFQLQMTGYMFRNAEYVLALKDLMDLRGPATLQDYKEAFDRLDADNSGYIESTDIEALLKDVYEDEGPPAFEVDTFLNFFDSNQDGRISWQEFEKGLGAMTQQRAANAVQKSNRLLSPQEDEDDDEQVGDVSTEPEVSGKIKVELKDGTVMEVEAKDYIRDLKTEAEALKEALRQESGQVNEPASGLAPGSSVIPSDEDSVGGIAGYIASLQGDVKSLTEGISPEVVEAMRLLVDYVIEGGPSKKTEKASDKDKLEMEIPGSALQQLALWQLVLGYRLREAEATGEYLRMLE